MAEEKLKLIIATNSPPQRHQHRPPEILRKITSSICDTKIVEINSHSDLSDHRTKLKDLKAQALIWTATNATHITPPQLIKLASKSLCPLRWDKRKLFTLLVVKMFDAEKEKGKEKRVGWGFRQMDWNNEEDRENRDDTGAFRAYEVIEGRSLGEDIWDGLPLFLRDGLVAGHAGWEEEVD